MRTRYQADSEKNEHKTGEGRKGEIIRRNDNRNNQMNRGNHAASESPRARTNGAVSDLRWHRPN